ncbi:type IV secretory system conjugative DNA transfer family protein [Saliphagus sp. LR7]|uniref:type IV secretory system conjugative DNA transfer family protein n=1 Tax=Saliphagus sp. LR7 TaxID=2282654 RepID=UPI000DF73A67|nr:type IV secretion system DNA-binding domain-containing protein [Saliphagus sp. LR7]
MFDNLFSGSGPQPLEIDDELNQTIHQQAREHPLVGIRPYRESGSLEKGRQLLNSLHDVDRGGFLNRKNVSNAHTFELHYTDSTETLSFRFVPGDERTRQLLGRQLKTFYDDSDVIDPSPVFLNTEPGHAVAGASLQLRQAKGTGKFKPIKHFKLDPDHFDQDPYDAITAEMVDPAARSDADVLIQIVIKPAISDPQSRKKWYDGIEKAAEEIRNPKTGFQASGMADELAKITNPEKRGEDPKEQFTRSLDVGDSQSKAARVILDQHGEKGYHVNIRVFASSADPEEACRRVEKTAKMFRKFYDSKFEQGFVPTFQSGSDLRDLVLQGVNREWTDANITFSSDTLVGVCHVPTDINTQQTDYAMATSGRGIPPGTPRFDFEDAGIPDTAEDLEKQSAMLNTRDPDMPYWYGLGTKNQIEAGVSADLLDVHQFIGGGTGFGKTTLLNNFAYQIANRDHGMLYFDPKGTGDARDFLAAIPEHREDDVIYIELGGDPDQRVGFNFLEPPIEADPDSTSFLSGIESLADDIAALLAQAGGDREFWGPTMNMITRNLVRGMARSGMQCTLFDLWAALNPEGMQKYAEQMTEERIAFIEDFARETLQEMDASEIRPVKNRLQQWVENPVVLEYVSFPESTVSIEDAVADGKIIVVDTSVSSDTIKQLFATALIRRTWMAVREQTYRNDDPPPYFVLCDEFDSIVTPQSNIHSVLSEARAFGYCLTLACQNPWNQLPEQVAHAIENQCRTFLSFNAGGEKDSQFIAGQHSDDVEPADLMNLSPYRIYMRTEDQHNELTHSYKVDAFPPIEWAVDERDEEGVEALIERSLEKYGQERRTAEDIKEDAVFYDEAATPEDAAALGSQAGAAVADDAEAAKADLESEEAQQALYEAAYAVQVRQDSVGGFVPAEDVKADWSRRAGELGYQSKPSQVLERTPEDYLERERRGGDSMLRLTVEGREAADLLQDTGSSASGGGDEHRWVLTQSFEAFTKLGMWVELPTQEGEEDPDGLADLPIDPMAGETLAEIHEREERLRDEYPELWALTEGRHISIEAETSTITKPMQTLTNLRKAMEEQHLCVFAVKDGTAEHDEFGYWARRGEQIIFRTEGPVQNQTIEHDQLTFVSDVDQAGNRQFYNKGAKYRPEPEVVALRPRNTYDLVWCEDDDEVVMGDSKGNEFTRFGSVKEAENPNRDSIPAYYEHDPRTDEYTLTIKGETQVVDSKEAIKKDWMPVRAPFIPEHEFPQEPTIDDFMFVIFPDDDNEEYGGPQIYEQGEFRPLLPSDREETPPSRSEALKDEATKGSDDSAPEANSNEEDLRSDRDEDKRFL